MAIGFNPFVWMSVVKKYQEKRIDWDSIHQMIMEQIENDVQQKGTLLSVGSIVCLKEVSEPVMITKRSFYYSDHQTMNVYKGISVKKAKAGILVYCYFNREDIDHVISQGYRNEQERLMSQWHQYRLLHQQLAPPMFFNHMETEKREEKEMPIPLGSVVKLYENDRLLCVMGYYEEMIHVCSFEAGMDVDECESNIRMDEIERIDFVQLGS